jgi:hypothetical protein
VRLLPEDSSRSLQVRFLDRCFDWYVMDALPVAVDAAHESLRAYRERLLARAPFARVVEEARPYRPLFPLGAPDGD